MHDTDGIEIFSSAELALIESSLWQENQDPPAHLCWLERSWEDPVAFGKALHTYYDRRQASQSKSVLFTHYDFYHDLLVRHKNQSGRAYIWFAKGVWHTWSYAELNSMVNGLAAAWETMNVQPGEILTILHPPGPHWLVSLLAGLRLGLSICLLSPQGNAFVHRRLKNITPDWLAIDQLYRHQLDAEWQDKVLPNALAASEPVRRSYEYNGTDPVILSFDLTGPLPDAVVPITADSLFLGTLRDSVFALGIKSGQLCSAPGWHVSESQPALILALLMAGGAWVHIDFADLQQQPQRLLDQPIHILGVNRALRDLLRRSPLVGEKNWHLWFRHPAEMADSEHWQDFVKQLRLEKTYAGNIVWNAACGGAILFSPKCIGRSHFWIMPAAALHWQSGLIDAPDLPGLGGWGRMALGVTQDGKTEWNPLPYMIVPYETAWHYLGQFPSGRAGRTYFRQEVLELLADTVHYRAIVEAAVERGRDPQQILLTFGSAYNVDVLRKLIEIELGRDFLPDRIENFPFLPKRNTEGGADETWCQLHYLTGELYRRQRSPLHLSLSALKQKILAG